MNKGEPNPEIRGRGRKLIPSWMNGKLLAGGLILFTLFVFVLLGKLFYDTDLQRVASSPLNLPPYGFPEPGPAFQPGSAQHPLGTESSGRDMLALLITGTPNSFLVGIIAAGVGVGAGTILGLISGFTGGRVDTVIRICSDAFITIPSLAVLIVISSFVSEIDLLSMGLLLALFAWPGTTRVIRAQVLSMRESGYVKMARLAGMARWRILFFELMPNLLPFIAATFTAGVSGNIIAATGLEALGLGPSRVTTLGMTIYHAISGAAILRGMWWWWGLPILVLMLVFIGLFLLAIGMDELVNPRLRGKGAT